VGRAGARPLLAGSGRPPPDLKWCVVGRTPVQLSNADPLLAQPLGGGLAGPHDGAGQHAPGVGGEFGGDVHAVAHARRPGVLPAQRRRAV
jgi:hypothetical protein